MNTQYLIDLFNTGGILISALLVLLCLDLVFRLISTAVRFFAPPLKLTKNAFLWKWNVDTQIGEVGSIKTDVSNLKANVSDLKTDVSILKTDVSDLKTDVSELNTGVSNLGTRVNRIELDIGEIKNALEISTASKSPRTLSNVGKKISSQLKAADLVEPIAAKLVKRTEKMSAYDVQQFCYDYFREEFKPSKDLISSMKDTAYKNGVSLGTVNVVFAIELRDALLKIHK